MGYLTCSQALSSEGLLLLSLQIVACPLMLGCGEAATPESIPGPEQEPLECRFWEEGGVCVVGDSLLGAMVK